MRQSHHLGKTMKEIPKEAQTIAHKLMLRGGYMKRLSSGIYSYLPLLYRTLNKISNIVREEMNAKGAEELLMPALQPKNLWVESGRWERYTEVDGIMFSFKDRRGGMCCLGPTHEEVITDIVRKEIDSYKELPIIPYQIQTKFRDEIRPRFGLMRTREFIMKDAYSFDLDEAGLDKSYQDMNEAYHNICKRCGFDYRSVEADTGAIGGSSSQEFMVLAETGEDTIMYCDCCDYAANLERAESRLEEYSQDTEPKKMEEVYGEGIVGVKELSEFLKIPYWHTTKTMLYQADDKVVAVMVRGDTDVHEIKVQNYLGSKTLELATPEVVRKITGAEVGYAGPVGLPTEVQILADNYTKNRFNFECGANKTNYHNINVNFEKDFPLPVFGDFKLAQKGDGCPRCEKGKLKEARGIEVGHIFKLGKKYSEIMKCTYKDDKGEIKPMLMGCYGIGVSRIAAAVIEQRHDDKGIIWPKNIAPYQVHLIGLNLDQEDIKTEAEKIYTELQVAGIEVFFDDRINTRTGEKFSDADLIGLPIRITFSKRTMEKEEVEWKLRDGGDVEMVKRSEIIKNLTNYYGVIKN